MLLNYYHSQGCLEQADPHTTITVNQWCHEVARRPLRDAEFLVHRVDFVPLFFANLLLESRLVSEGRGGPGVTSCRQPPAAS